MTQGNQVDKSTYESARTYLKDALEHMLAAGRDAREFGEFALEKFGDHFIPYLQEFSQDINKGKVKVKGLSKSAKSAVFGRHVTLDEREQLIREEAYLRAERRGFVGGSPEEDWCEAEREIDLRLARETGLVEKGRQTLTSASTIVEREFDDIRHVVGGWLESKPAAEQGVVGGSQVAKVAEPKQAQPTKKKAVTKQAAQKKAVKKKSAKKKTVKAK